MFNTLSTMQLYRSLLLTALVSTCVRAQTLTEPEIHSAVAAPNAAALATPTILGDPTQPSSYPLCAQKCGNQSVALVPLVDYGCDLAEVACQCQPQFRATTAACEEITCDSREYLKAQALAKQLCGPFYEKNSALGSAVSSAIASATSVAFTATESKIPTNPAEYPRCAQVCFDEYIPQSGCGDLANRTCICGSESLVFNLGPCERKCSTTDPEKIFALVNELCFTVGGPVADPNPSVLSGTGSTSNNSTSLPSPLSFTGHAPANMAGGLALCIMIGVGYTGFVVLVL